MVVNDRLHTRCPEHPHSLVDKSNVHHSLIGNQKDSVGTKIGSIAPKQIQSPIPEHDFG
jgi:hypothetical protein